MTGVPAAQALVLAISVIAIIAAPRAGFHPFLVLTIAASAFGLTVGLSVGLIGKAFGNGFSEALYLPGLVIVAMVLVTGIAEQTGTTDSLATVARRPRLINSDWMMASVGLLAGIGASPATALALLNPLLQRGGEKSRRERNATRVALAISAGHGLIWLSPVPIAAAAILGAGWQRVAMFGVPVAVASAAVGIGWTHLVSQPQSAMSDPSGLKDKSGSRTDAVLLAACLIPLLMLMAQSVGDMPSEPVGGGAHRELILGIGRPLVLFLVSMCIMTLGHWRLSLKCLKDSEWTGRNLGKAAGIILTVGAAGGLQRLCQQTGMAELLGERLSTWHVAGAAGVLIPFLVAAVVKTLQGSSLVAAITTAGMMQPLLSPLGLDSESGIALAALAVGAGTMLISHVNDDFFWLVSYATEFSPPRTLGTFSVATLLQGCAAAILLLFFATFVV
jgi:gluconate:H+ symporter, GntP family